MHTFRMGHLDGAHVLLHEQGIRVGGGGGFGARVGGEAGGGR